MESQTYLRSQKSAVAVKLHIGSEMCHVEKQNFLFLSDLKGDLKTELWGELKTVAVALKMPLVVFCSKTDHEKKKEKKSPQKQSQSVYRTLFFIFFERYR